MRHRVKEFRLNRFTSWRKATIKSLTRNLLIHQGIKTTEQKAKAVREEAERLISLAKEDTLLAKRTAFQVLGDHRLVKLLFVEIGPRFKDRVGGYTRIFHLGCRRGDNASVVLLELTEIKKKEPPKKHKKEKGIKETKAETPPKPETPKEEAIEEKKKETKIVTEQKPTQTKKPSKKFFGGIRNIFKKERDSL